MAEDLNLDAGLGAGFGKGADGGIVQPDQIELDGIRRAGFRGQRGGDVDLGGGVQLGRDVVMVAQPVGHTAGQFGQLGPHQHR